MIGPRTNQRKGALAPLAGVMMVIFVGMVAFAVDTAWIATTQGELQNAADSAALAGAMPLMDGFVQYNLPGQTEKAAILTAYTAAAMVRAKDYAQKNAAGEVRSLQLLDTDIEFGFINASNQYQGPGNFTGFPNTIKVVLRRDTTANGRLGLFFAPAIGNNATNLDATASATIFGGSIMSFKNDPTYKIGILPITYDVDDWKQFVTTGISSSNEVSDDEEGNPQINIYPSNMDKGNFGMLGLDDEHAGSDELRDWVNYGLDANDLKNLVDRQLIPLNAASAFDWLGDPGYRSTVIQAINNYQGRTYTLPLCKAYSSSPYQFGVGQGSKYNYNVVELVGVRIMPGGRYNRDVIVQPAAVIEPNAAFDPATVLPAGTAPTNPTLVTTFTTPKLTR